MFILYIRNCDLSFSMFDIRNY